MAIFMIVLLILGLALLYVSQISQEPYIDRYCNEHGNCKECMKISGCAWCPLAKKCKLASTIKSEENCNPDNVITVLDQCNTKDESTFEETYDEMSLIHDNAKPPGVYVSSEKEYSNQTVMADVSKLREEVSHLEQELPDIIASTVQKVLSSQPAPFR